MELVLTALELIQSIELCRKCYLNVMRGMDMFGYSPGDLGCIEVGND